MASKGQKFKKYSSEFKEQILKEYFDGNGAESLGHKYSISPGTIRNWINKLKKGDNLSILKKYQAFLQARRGKK